MHSTAQLLEKMSIPPLTVDQLLSTVTLDQQAWLDDHFTTVRELAAAASEFVRAKKEEERVNAKPDISTHILKTKLLSRWPTKFGSMREDPANKWKVMKELDMLNYAGELPRLQWLTCAASHYHSIDS